MKIKILSPLWGHEHLPAKTFLEKIRIAGYDGVDTWVPAEKKYRHTLYDYLHGHRMTLVTHQHSAEGSTFAKFKKAYIRNLQLCAEPRPLLINSHTGKDHFSIRQHITLIDAAQEFSEKSGIPVAHETHRGRLGYCPQMMAELLDKRNNFFITADLSHWVCVTESMLENFGPTIDAVIQRSIHVHARIGYEQGPQVSDPRVPAYQYALDRFLGWWDNIVSANKKLQREVLTFTTEFGPAPYMPLNPADQAPLSDQFEVNVFMKDLLRTRYNKAMIA